VRLTARPDIDVTQYVTFGSIFHTGIEISHYSNNHPNNFENISKEIIAIDIIRRVKVIF